MYHARYGKGKVFLTSFYNVRHFFTWHESKNHSPHWTSIYLPSRQSLNFSLLPFLVPPEMDLLCHVMPKSYTHTHTQELLKVILLIDLEVALLGHMVSVFLIF